MPEDVYEIRIVGDPSSLAVAARQAEQSLRQMGRVAEQEIRRAGDLGKQLALPFGQQQLGLPTTLRQIPGAVREAGQSLQEFSRNQEVAQQSTELYEGSFRGLTRAVRLAVYQLAGEFSPAVAGAVFVIDRAALSFQLTKGAIGLWAAGLTIAGGSLGLIIRYLQQVKEEQEKFNTALRSSDLSVHAAATRELVEEYRKLSEKFPDVRKGFEEIAQGPSGLGEESFVDIFAARAASRLDVLEGRIREFGDRAIRNLELVRAQAALPGGPFEQGMEEELQAIQAGVAANRAQIEARNAVLQARAQILQTRAQLITAQPVLGETAGEISRAAELRRKAIDLEIQQTKESGRINAEAARARREGSIAAEIEKQTAATVMNLQLQKEVSKVEEQRARIQADLQRSIRERLGSEETTLEGAKAAAEEMNAAIRTGLDVVKEQRDLQDSLRQSTIQTLQALANLATSHPILGTGAAAVEESIRLRRQAIEMQIEGIQSTAEALAQQKRQEPGGGFEADVVLRKAAEEIKRLQIGLQQLDMERLRMLLSGVVPGQAQQSLATNLQVQTEAILSQGRRLGIELSDEVAKGVSGAEGDVQRFSFLDRVRRADRLREMAAAGYYANVGKTLGEQFSHGFDLGVLQFQDSLANFGRDSADLTRNIGEHMTQGLEDTFFAITTNNFRSLVDVGRQAGLAIVREFNRATARLVMRGLVGGDEGGGLLNLGGGFGGGGGLLSWLMGGGQAGIAKGLVGAGEFWGAGAGEMASSLGLIALQHGGIVRKPTVAMLAEGGRPEAVVPLDQLDQQGGGGKSGVTIINLSDKDQLSVIMAQEMAKGREVIVNDVISGLRGNNPIRRGLRRFA